MRGFIAPNNRRSLAIIIALRRAMQHACSMYIYIYIVRRENCRAILPKFAIYKRDKKIAKPFETSARRSDRSAD